MGLIQGGKNIAKETGHQAVEDGDERVAQGKGQAAELLFGDTGSGELHIKWIEKHECSSQDRSEKRKKKDRALLRAFPDPGQENDRHKEKGEEEADIL